MSEYKFKKGDRVVAAKDCRHGGFLKGYKGTVDQDNSTVPYVLWDNGRRNGALQEEIKLDKPTPLVKIAVSFENDSEKMAYLRYCESIGLRTYGKRSPLSFRDFEARFASFEQDMTWSFIANSFTEVGYTIVPFKVFAELKGIDYTPIVEVKLNDTHKAVIENGKVKVGCQQFEFERIEALYNAVKEATK